MFVNQLKKNKIEIVYLIKPLWQSNEVFEKGLNVNCFKKIKVNEILDTYILKECEDLKDE